MIVSHPNQTQGQRPRGDGCDQQALVQRAQIEASVETITERRKVTRGVLSEVKGMVATRQTGFEIAEDGVNPLELHLNSNNRGQTTIIPFIKRINKPRERKWGQTRLILTPFVPIVRPPFHGVGKSYD